MPAGWGARRHYPFHAAMVTMSGSPLEWMQETSTMASALL